MRGSKPSARAHRQQVAAAQLAAGDPRCVAQRLERAPPAGREQVDRIVEQVVEADVGGLGVGLVVAEADRDVDLAGAQQLERLGRVHVEQRDLQLGVARGQRRHRPRHERADRGREAGEPHAPGGEADVGGELRARGVDPADDLRRPVREQLPGRREPDAAADPLEELRARLRLEPREVVADRRLRVVQLLRGRGHRAVAGDRVDHAQAVDVEHHINLTYELPRMLALDL